MDDLKLIGPVGYRQFHLDKACERNSQHEHNYDHVWFLLRGQARVEYEYVDGDGSVRKGSSSHSAPDKVLIKAHVKHEIIAESDDVDYECIFSHRDFDGIVSQAYKGNTKAYV